MTKTSKTNKTRWHRLLGSLLEQLLTPVGILVQCDVKIMVNPPEADILLLRRQSLKWTNEQYQRLPDGIRDSMASHILLEFKYTESVNETALQQTLSYDFFYKRAQTLSNEQIQSFLISAKTPHLATLTQFGDQKSKHKGVYYTKIPLLKQAILIVLNELSDEPHNAWLKCFASRYQEKRKAFALLDKMESKKLNLFLSGLRKHWFEEKKEYKMNTELTPESLIEMGKSWGEFYLSHLNAEERLAGLDAEERLAGLGTKERLAGLKTREIVSAVDHKKILAELSVEEIETYLHQIKAQH